MAPTNTGSTARPFAEGDHAAILDIYNHYVRSSHCTFDTEPFSAAQRLPWFSQFDGKRYQCWVSVAQGRLLGYACTTPFKTKPAYQTSVEVSVYVAPDSSSRGIGAMLYGALIPQLAQHDVHRVYAGIALPNNASLALHERFGFTRSALFREVGRKFGRYWDVAWYELGI